MQGKLATFYFLRCNTQLYIFASFSLQAFMTKIWIIGTNYCITHECFHLFKIDLIFSKNLTLYHVYPLLLCSCKKFSLND